MSTKPSVPGRGIAVEIVGRDPRLAGEPAVEGG